LYICGSKVPGLTGRPSN